MFLALVINFITSLLAWLIIVLVLSFLMSKILKNPFLKIWKKAQWIPLVISIGLIPHWYYKETSYQSNRKLSKFEESPFLQSAYSKINNLPKDKGLRFSEILLDQSSDENVNYIEFQELLKIADLNDMEIESLRKHYAVFIPYCVDIEMHFLLNILSSTTINNRHEIVSCEEYLKKTGVKGAEEVILSNKRIEKFKEIATKPNGNLEKVDFEKTVYEGIEINKKNRERFEKLLTIKGS